MQTTEEHIKKLTHENRRLLAALIAIMREVDETTARCGWSGNGGRKRAMDAIVATEEYGQELHLTLLSGVELTLMPIPMSAKPSKSPAQWLRFQGQHIPHSRLSPTEARRLQAFMRHWQTDAVSDGTMPLTLAGDMLAACDLNALQD